MSPPTGEMFVFNIPPGDSFRKDNVQDTCEIPSLVRDSLGSILIGSYISPIFFSLAVYQPSRTIQKHLVIKASSPSFRQRVCCLILFEL